MKILVALGFLSVAAGVTIVKRDACENPIHCPCGSTGKNITICAGDSKDEPCRKWLQCKTCRDNLDNCSECPEGFEGPFCSTASRRNNVTRQKRQHRFHTHGSRPLTGNRNPTGQGGAGGHCDLVPQGAGSFNCTTGRDGTRCDVFCNGRNTGRYFCYPGHSWSPSLPYCMKPKVAEEYHSCNCENGGSCDNDGNCVCPVGRAGRFCETKSPDTSLSYCPDPGVDSNGRRSPRSPPSRRGFPQGSQLEYSCNRGFDLHGETIIFCYTSGEWSSERPLCESHGHGYDREPANTERDIIYCPDPGVDSNGKRRPRVPPSQRGFPQGSQLHYSCNRDYDLHGETILFCFTSGEWSSGRPLCEYHDHGHGREPARPGSRLNYCLDPGVDPNGRRNPQLPPNQRGFPPGSQLEYSCNHGYYLHGETNIFCLVTGDWSYGPPTCGYDADIPVIPDTDTSFCRDPGVDPNGRRNPRFSPNQSGFPQGSQVEYSCNQGYELVGDSIIYCLTFGEWSSVRPICESEPFESGSIQVAYCQNPGSITNGRAEYYPVINNRQRPRPQTTLDDPEYPIGARIQYHCNRGYNLEGSGSLTCEENGYWSAERPVCRRGNSLTFCRDPGVDPNGNRVPRAVSNPRGFREGTRLDYSCNQGYDLEGEQSLSCLPSGVWSSQTPICKTQTRGPENVQVAYCLNPGTVLNGQAVYYPVINNRQSVHPQTTLDDPEYPLGAIIQYYCDSGYNLEGSDTLTCEANGDWSAKRPVCRRGNENDGLTCINPGPILNGIIRNYPPGTRPRTGSTNLVAEDTRDFPEGTRLEFECNEGYNLEGTMGLTCESNGLWSPPTAPKCNSDCGRSTMGTTRRILNGNKTSIGEWPWVVAVAVQERNGPRLICGGVVLNTQTIITAAHCLNEASQFVLYFGKYYRKNNLDDEQVQERMSRTVIINPEFNNDTLDSDIALIKFRPSIRYSDRVQPICLPTGESTAQNLRAGAGRRGYVTGWGHTEKRLGSNELLVAQLPFVTNEACLQSFRENVKNFIPVLTQNMFCAGYHDARQATCRGDSGSPLVYYDSMTERFTLEGLVSFGVEGQCGLPGRFSVFTKVVRFLSWIYKNM